MRTSYTAQQRVTALRATIAQAENGAPTQVTAAIATFRTALDKALGADGERRDRGTFRDANDALGAQLTAQDNADNAPNAAMLAAAAKVSRDITLAEAAWRALLARDLPALNAVLTRTNRPAITVP